jgi:hypothetical protein
LLAEISATWQRVNIFELGLFVIKNRQKSRKLYINCKYGRVPVFPKHIKPFNKANLFLGCVCFFSVNKVQKSLLEHIPKAVSVHNLNEDTEALLLRHLQHILNLQIKIKISFLYISVVLSVFV